MQRIESGETTQKIVFNTGVTGLSSFLVYRSRNGSSVILMTTPTIVERSATFMPGEYTLVADEDMTMDSNFLTETMVYWITGPGFSPVRVQIELYLDEINVRSMNQFLVQGEGDASSKWRGNGAA